MTVETVKRLDKATQERWVLQRLKDVSRDYYRYSGKNLWIKDKAGNMIRFSPNPMQKEVLDYIIDCKKRRVPCRIIILKARQEGMSTAIESYIYFDTATNKHVGSKIVSHDDESASKIATMFKRFYDNSSAMFKPMKKYGTKDGDMTFANPKLKLKPGDHPGLQSAISTASARNTSVGRGDTLRNVHGSEVAFWPDGAQLVAGLLQAVPMLPDTFVALESTANGMGGYFYDEWQVAKSGESAFRAFFFGWQDNPEYSIPAPGPMELNDEEQKLKATYHLSDAQLNWRREKMKEFKNDPKLFRQEYPANDIEAFIASGRPVFDLELLVQMETHCFEGEHGWLHEVKEGARKGAYEWRHEDYEAFQVWEHPVRDDLASKTTKHDYVIAGDVAEGLEHGDYSVLDVKDKTTGRTVARWRGHCDPDVLGHYAYAIGRYYNTALIAIEINNHGLTTVQVLKDLQYERLYRRRSKFTERLEDTTSDLGWQTNITTKRLMIDTLVEAVRDGSYHDPDKYAIREMMTYVRDDNGRTNAQIGCYDDRVMAAAIALQALNYQHAQPKSLVKSYVPPKMAKMKAARRT